MRKLCILCCVIVICFLVCFVVSADMALPGGGSVTPYVQHSVRDIILSDLRAIWSVIVAAALAVATFFTKLFHKK